MPFPNNHSLRLSNPDGFDDKSFRQTKGGKKITVKGVGRIDIPENINIIWAKPKDASAPNDPPIAQALRFPIDSYTEKQARSWINNMGLQSFKFELAEQKDMKENMEFPVNVFGFSTSQTLSAMREIQRQYRKEESNFKSISQDPLKTCGTCRFYLRSVDSEIGRCQVVEGDIPWFSTSDFYISANEEAVASFSHMMESAHPVKRSPKFDVLKKHKKKMTEEERSEVMNAKAVWHHGPNGEETPAVWKSVVEGQEWFVTNTHRAYNVMSTIKGAIDRYHRFIKLTAAMDTEKRKVIKVKDPAYLIGRLKKNQEALVLSAEDRKISENKKYFLADETHVFATISFRQEDDKITESSDLGRRGLGMDIMTRTQLSESKGSFHVLKLKLEEDHDMATQIIGMENLKSFEGIAAI